MERGGGWWDREAPLQPRGKRAAERSGWVQALVQPQSSCANLSTSHNVWRLGFCHLCRRDAEAGNTCYIVTSRWHLAQRQALSGTSVEAAPQCPLPGDIVARREVGARSGGV